MKGNREPFRSILLGFALLTAVPLLHLASSGQPVNSLPLSIFSSLSWFTQGDQPGADFGAAVNTAGDINGDGFADIIIGAPKYTIEGNKGGAVFVYYGSAAGLPDQPDWIMGGERKGSEFGFTVSTAGDVNGDTFDDVIIGAYEYTTDDANTSHEGRAYVYYGSSSGLSTTAADWVLTGTHSGENFGYAVATAGDVNNDGYDDVIVGARHYPQDDKLVGAAMLFYGSAAGLTQTAPDWMVLGDQAGANFGGSVNTAGDVNGDGCDDIIVGAPNYDNGQDEEGAAFVYLGSPTGPDPGGSYAWMAEGETENAGFGASVSTAGSVNGDAFADVIVGAPHYSGSLPDEGGVFVFHGSALGLEGNASWTAVSGQTASGFGISVSTAGDVNQDGFDDVLVGANQYTHEHANEGGIFVYLGAPDQLQSTYWMAIGGKADTQMGYAVGAAGDVTGDGCADVIAGAPEYRQSTDLLGRAFVYYGSDSDYSYPYHVYLPITLNASP